MCSMTRPSLTLSAIYSLINHIITWEIGTELGLLVLSNPKNERHKFSGYLIPTRIPTRTIMFMYHICIFMVKSCFYTKVVHQYNSNTQESFSWIDGRTKGVGIKRGTTPFTSELALCPLLHIDWYEIFSLEMTNKKRRGRKWVNYSSAPKNGNYIEHHSRN